MSKFKIDDYVKYAIVDEKPDGDGKVFLRGKGIITGIEPNGCYSISDCSCLAKEEELQLSTFGIKDLVKGNSMAEFDYFMDGNLYYIVEDQNTGLEYRFFIPVDETGHSTFKAREKSITFMRWIRKSIENKTLVKV